jgi:isoleucyl-tRNA synthetase
MPIGHTRNRMYKTVDPRVNFPAMEEAILKFWEEEKIFKKIP